MDQARIILEQLAAGGSVEQVAQQFLWPQLPLEERERLLQEAETRGQHGEAHLIRWLAKAVSYPNADAWDRIRIAVLFVKWIDDEPARAARLKRIQAELDLLVSRALGRDDRARLNTLQGDCCVLRANLELDRDNLAAGIESLEQAMTLYAAGGCAERENAVSSRLDRLRAIQEQRRHLLPLDQVRVARADLEYQLIQLETRIDQKTSQADQLSRSVQDVEQAVADLEQYRRRMQDESARLAGEARVRSEQLDRLKRDMARLTADRDGLANLIAMQQAALDQARGAIAQARTQLDELRQQCSEIERARATEQSGLGELREKSEQLKESVAQLEKQKADLESQLANAGNDRRLPAGAPRPKLSRPSFLG